MVTLPPRVAVSQCGGAAECAYVTPVGRADQSRVKLGVYGRARRHVHQQLFVLGFIVGTCLNIVIVDNIFNDECVDIKMVW